jgi:glutathione S-transferase
MANDLVFYTNPQSRGRIVRWMLEELGQPYRTEILDFATTLKGAEYLAINPMGKVPALRHGETVVTEAAAICAYLADAFPASRLAPPWGSPLRGPYYRWLFYVAGVLEPAIVTHKLGFEVAPEHQRMAGWGCFAQAVDTLESAVQGRDYIVGDSFTAADVYVGAHIGWGMQIGALERRPAFVAYASKLQARPAAERAAVIDNELAAAASR